MVLLSLGCFRLTFWLHFLHCILYRSTHSETMIQIASIRLCNVYIGDICYHGKSLVLTIGCNFLQWELNNAIALLRIRLGYQCQLLNQAN